MTAAEERDLWRLIAAELHATIVCDTRPDRHGNLPALRACHHARNYRYDKARKWLDR